MTQFGAMSQFVFLPLLFKKAWRTGDKREQGCEYSQLFSVQMINSKWSRTSALYFVLLGLWVLSWRRIEGNVLPGKVFFKKSFDSLSKVFIQSGAANWRGYQIIFGALSVRSLRTLLFAIFLSCSDPNRTLSQIIFYYVWCLVMVDMVFQHRIDYLL